VVLVIGQKGDYEMDTAVRGLMLADRYLYDVAVSIQNTAKKQGRAIYVMRDDPVFR